MKHINTFPTHEENGYPITNPKHVSDVFDTGVSFNALWVTFDDTMIQQTL